MKTSVLPSGGNSGTASNRKTAALGLPSNTGAPKYHPFDLLGSYTLTDNLWLRFGVENIFDKAPPVVGLNPNDVTGMYGGSFNSTNYDTRGRRFYFGARVNLE